MKTFKSNIRYLGDEHFGPRGKLLYSMGLPVVVMIQGSYCGYCRDMKPHFQAAADHYPGRKVTWATVEIDGEHPQQKKLAARLAKILKMKGIDFKGVPMVVIFINGNPRSVYSGDEPRRRNNLRCSHAKPQIASPTEQSLIQFVLKQFSYINV